MSNNVLQMLESGWQCTQRGQHLQAEQLYQRVLLEDRANADALLGLAVSCHFQGKFGDAIGAYQRLLRQRPNLADAHNNMGVAYIEQGKFDEAKACYERAIRVQPTYADAHSNLGRVYARLGNLDQAIACYREALKYRPEFPDAYNNLGLAFADQNKFDEALEAYNQAIKGNPNHAKAYYNRGILFGRQGRFEEAADSTRQAIRLQPNYPEAYHNLGTFLASAGHLDEAIGCYQGELRLNPHSADAYSNLGLVLMDQGRHEEAMTALDRSVQIQPNNVEAHLHKGLLFLLKGDFERGFPEFEWRWRKAIRPRPFTQPLWDGSSLAGKTILLHAEQGLGDTIQYLRYAQLVKAQGARVLVECQKALARLAATCPGIDQLFVQGDALPAFDVHAPLMSLPRIMKTTVTTIPAPTPYLEAQPALVEKWKKELDAIPGFKIGIAWKGSSTMRGDRYRSFGLQEFAPLAELPGVKLVSLQKGEGSEQVKKFADRWPIIDWTERMDTEAGPFADTAAILKGVDLVISADTSINHLAGALGVPSFLAVSVATHWCWLLERSDSPWYPTLKLFRQKRLNEWRPVFEAMAEEVRRRLGDAPLLPIQVEIAAGELLDKLTILEIKKERIADPAKRENVRAELATLTAVREKTLPRSAELDRLTDELRAANAKIWDIEEAVRACEREKRFDAHFIETARAVYHTNDHRAALKRQINELLKSRLVEEKSYAAY